MEKPSLRILHFPFFHQQPNMLSFVEIIGAETAQDHAPYAIHERNTVGVRIERLHRLGDADGDACFSGLERRNGDGPDKSCKAKRSNATRFHVFPSAVRKYDPRSSILDPQSSTFYRPVTP